MPNKRLEPTAQTIRVAFGPEAWMLRCECSSGVYIVTFEPDLESLEAGNGKQRIILNPGAMLEGHFTKSIDPKLEEDVLAAVEQHLRLIGYDVIRFKA